MHLNLNILVYYNNTNITPYRLNKYYKFKLKKKNSLTGNLFYNRFT